MLSVVSNNGTKLYLQIKTCSDFEWLFLANFVAGIYTLIVLQQMQACQVSANLYRCLTSQIHFNQMFCGSTYIKFLLLTRLILQGY